MKVANYGLCHHHLLTIATSTDMKAIRVIFLVTLTATIASCGFVVTTKKAEKIAAQRLADYCTAERMSVTNFSKPTMTSDAEHQWIFDFESSTTPKHSVRIYVYKSGKADTHRMVE